MDSLWEVAKTIWKEGDTSLEGKINFKKMSKEGDRKRGKGVLDKNGSAHIVKQKGVVISEGKFQIKVDDIENEEDMGLQGPSDEEEENLELGLTEEEKVKRRRVRRGKREKWVDKKRKNKCEGRRKISAQRDWPNLSGPSGPSTPGEGPSRLMQITEHELGCVDGGAAQTGPIVLMNNGARAEINEDGLKLVIRRRARKLFEKWARKVKFMVLQMTCKEDIVGGVAESPAGEVPDDGTSHKHRSQRQVTKLKDSSSEEEKVNGKGEEGETYWRGLLTEEDGNRRRIRRRSSNTKRRRDTRSS